MLRLNPFRRFHSQAVLARRLISRDVPGDSEGSGAVVDRQARVRALDDRWERLQRLMRERGADPSLDGVAGGTTGLIVRRVRSVGSGDNARLVVEHELDTGLLNAMLAHEKQVAQELGQWDDHVTLATDDVRPPRIVIPKVDDRWEIRPPADSAG
jgi:hypothetical protein